MPEKKNRMHITSIGSSLLLVIFLILSLIMFATLSITTARSNYLISQREADRVTNRTEANNASEEILASLPSLCKEAAEENSQTVTTSAGDVIVSISQNETGHTIFSWQIAFSDSQAISVAVDLASLNEPENYTITCWKTITTSEWSSTDTIKVLTP